MRYLKLKNLKPRSRSYSKATTLVRQFVVLNTDSKTSSPLLPSVFCRVAHTQSNNVYKVMQLGNVFHLSISLFFHFPFTLLATDLISRQIPYRNIYFFIKLHVRHIDAINPSCTFCNVSLQTIFTTPINYSLIQPAFLWSITIAVMYLFKHSVRFMHDATSFFTQCRFLLRHALAYSLVL